MYKPNVFSIILIYNLISYTLTTDRDVLDHKYILSFMYENNYKMFLVTS